MLAREIQKALRTCDAGDIDPETALEIYAHLLANISEVVSDADLRRLVIREAAMFRQFEKTVELQIPGGAATATRTGPLGHSLTRPVGAAALDVIHLLLVRIPV